MDAGRLILAGQVVSLNPASQSDGSWLCGALALEGTGERITFVGSDLPPCLVGSTVRMTGYWNRHQVHGLQFQVTRLWSERPRTREGIELYLAENVKGCGPKYARRIVNVLGTDCLDRLERNPDLVKPLLPGSRGAALAISVRRWAEESRRDTKAKRLVVRLREVNIGYATIRKIMAYFSTAEAAEVVVLHRPYRIAEVPGIGWATADRIALALGARRLGRNRIEAACLAALEKGMNEGHSGLPEAEVRSRAGILLSIPAGSARLRAVVRRLIRIGYLHDIGGILLRRDVSGAEWQFAERVATLMRVSRHLTPGQRNQLQPILAASGLTATQRNAVWMGLGHAVAILTGRPGSGKTTTLKTYLECCRALGWSVYVVAPTGKAASRAASVTGVPASTVHRLLGGSPSQATAPTLAVRVLVVDESSMADLETAAWLMSAIDPMRTSVLWTGDADQLPSVGHGQVLSDLISSGRIPVARLEEVWRQGRESRIITNACRLLDNVPLEMESSASRDWVFHEIRSDEAAASGRERLLSAVRDLVSEGVDPSRDIQVMAPMRPGPFGVDSLNTALQSMLNPHGETGPVIGGGDRVRVGDRVVMTRNLYDLPEPLYNGETGFVTEVARGAKQITLQVDGREIILRGVQCFMLRLAWAITVHRAQGSEYPFALLAYHHRAHGFMLDPGVLYTAITRAKQRFVLVGTREAVRLTQARLRRRTRYTGLTDRLQQLVR